MSDEKGKDGKQPSRRSRTSWSPELCSSELQGGARSREPLLQYSGRMESFISLSLFLSVWQVQKKKITITFFPSHAQI